MPRRAFAIFLIRFEKRLLIFFSSPRFHRIKPRDRREKASHSSPPLYTLFPIIGLPQAVGPSWPWPVLPRAGLGVARSTPTTLPIAADTKKAERVRLHRDASVSKASRRPASSEMFARTDWPRSRRRGIITAVAPPQRRHRDRHEVRRGVRYRDRCSICHMIGATSQSVLVASAIVTSGVGSPPFIREYPRLLRPHIAASIE